MLPLFPSASKSALDFTSALFYFAEMPQWPHAPLHLLTQAGAFMVTGSTYDKFPHLYSIDRLTRFRDLLFELALKYKWDLQAWAVLANHYHFVAISPDDPTTLKQLIQHLHSVSSREINRDDNVTGRRVWFQYWDSLITYQRSYLARLQYVHENPVRHGIVDDAREYDWCSASWFEETATPSFARTLSSLKTDRVNVKDDF